MDAAPQVASSDAWAPGEVARYARDILLLLVVIRLRKNSPTSLLHGTTRSMALVVCALTTVSGCAGDDGSDSSTGVANDTGSSESTGGTLSALSTGSTNAETGVADTGEPTPNPFGVCADARTSAECAQAAMSADYPDMPECGWFSVSTWTYQEMMCAESEADTGYCFVIDHPGSDDGCGEPAGPTCADSESSVWYNAPDDGELIELFVDEGALCDDPGTNTSFMRCEFDGETYTPPECECACPTG